MKKYLLILFMLFLALSACSSQSQNTNEPSSSASLIGAWALTAFGPADEPVPAVEGTQAGLTFSQEGRVSGSSGCNGLGGDYTVEGDEITFGEFVSTLMACEDPVMRQEDAARKVMTGTATYEIEGDTLTITNHDNVLVLRRSTSGTQEPESAPLIGTWKLTSYGPRDTLISALQDVDAKLTFQQDGTLGGTSGCNEFGGNYMVDGNEIEFREVVSTLMLCNGPIMGQEEAMYQVLSEKAAFQVEDNVLTILKNGQVLVLERQ